MILGDAHTAGGRCWLPPVGFGDIYTAEVFSAGREWAGAGGRVSGRASRLHLFYRAYQAFYVLLGGGLSALVTVRVLTAG